MPIQIEKLKDLCLKQREEIKALKDAVLFPDETNLQMHQLVEKQGEEIKKAKQVIPALQKEVSSLTAHLQCLALDLAQVFILISSHLEFIFSCLELLPRIACV